MLRLYKALKAENTPKEVIHFNEHQKETFIADDVRSYCIAVGMLRIIGR